MSRLGGLRGRSAMIRIVYNLLARLYAVPSFLIIKVLSRPMSGRSVTEQSKKFVKIGEARREVRRAE